jgi:hypothetical protein
MVPATRRLLLDWEREVTLAVAGFRADAGRDLVEPDYQELIFELLEGSADFRQRPVRRLRWDRSPER